MNRSENRRPPIVVRNEIVISASPERIWELLTDVDQWPSWYRACRWVRRESSRGTARPAWRWKAHPVELLSTVTAAERPRLFSFVADAPGLHAERSFTLDPAPNGAGTRVVSDEFQVGPLPWLGRWIIGPSLRAANQRMFEDLARAATQGAPPKATYRKGQVTT